MTIVQDAAGLSTQERIVEVATQYFYERGYHGTTMREIAAGVGIKAGSLYNHFPGKQEILLRIGERAMLPLYAGAVARLKGVSDVEEQLRTFVRWHVEYHCVHRQRCRVIDTQLDVLEPHNRAAIIEVRDAYEQLLRGILAAGERRRRWRVADLTVTTIAIATMCTEVDAWYREGGRLTPQEVGTIYADLVRNGIGGGRPARQRRTRSPAGSAGLTRAGSGSSSA